MLKLREQRQTDEAARQREAELQLEIEQLQRERERDRIMHEEAQREQRELLERERMAVEEAREQLRRDREALEELQEAQTRQEAAEVRREQEALRLQEELLDKQEELENRRQQQLDHVRSVEARMTQAAKEQLANLEQQEETRFMAAVVVPAAPPDAAPELAPAPTGRSSGSKTSDDDSASRTHLQRADSLNVFQAMATLGPASPAQRTAVEQCRNLPVAFLHRSHSTPQPSPGRLSRPLSSRPASVQGDAADADFQSRLEDMAQYLGIALPGEEHLLWIADAALKAKLPHGWVQTVDEEGLPLFVNHKTNESSSDHPCDGEFIELVETERQLRLSMTPEEIQHEIKCVIYVQRMARGMMARALVNRMKTDKERMMLTPMVTPKLTPTSGLSPHLVPEVSV